MPESRLRRPTTGLWNHPDFLKLWAGQSISEFGSQVSGLAIPWLAAVGLHASPFAFSLLTVLGFLPFIFFALPAGVWVDRLRRRPILIIGDAGRAVLLAYIPIAWAGGWLEIYQLLGLSFAIGVLTVFFDVAYQSYLPALVDREALVEGNSKLQTTVSAANVGGPPISGVLISALTAPYAIVVDAISFVLSTLFMLRIRQPEVLPEKTESTAKPKMWPELKEGLRFVTGHLELLRSDRVRDRDSLHAADTAPELVLGRIRLHRLRRRLDHRGADGEPLPAPRRRRRPRHLDDVRHVLGRHLRLPARAPRVRGPAALRGHPRDRLRRDGLQHRAGELPPGDLPRAPAGTHERDDALDRLGHDPARRPARRRARRVDIAPHRALGRSDRQHRPVPARAAHLRPRDQGDPEGRGGAAADGGRRGRRARRADDVAARGSRTCGRVARSGATAA